MGEKPILCDTKSSSGNMDSVQCWNGAKCDQIPTRARPMSDTLSKLAQLITCIEYKPKPQPSSSICKDCGHKFSDLNSLVRHQEREHALRKLHRCQRCGQKFVLLSSLQLHKCSHASSMCQTCRGKPQRGSSCPSCGTESSEDPFYHDNSPYACTPCGQAFSHKQGLLHHQQAGDCQPAKTLKPPSPSYASLPPSPPKTTASLTTCTLCTRTFRSSTGLACHMRFSHTHMKSSTEKNRVLKSSMLFPCRSCDKSFPKTSLLHQHRKEEHRREIKVRKLQRTSLKTTRQRQKGETYPCLHCGKEFLHHLTRWAHFRHYSSHHQTHLKLSGKSSGADAVGFHPKAAKDPRPSQENRPSKRGRARTKNLPVLTETKQEEAAETVKQDDSDGEDAEYACTSCDQVFSSKAELHVHENIHEEIPEERYQPANTCRCCSVCTFGIPLAEIPEVCEKKVYHCVPCAEAFIALDTFLEHCQKHLLRDNEDEFSDG
ncbi:zinc finger protein 91-like isoform X1 [Sinocyclocheilus anshuiensis]|uniref:zinc finger protein 91-like isoform X1 n=2 Tax=Sinocyclocheilus anshuiensis TaxID=1608454 RepID=UPI0007B82AFC|nr:PREDICTED: zinc finger protein 91-like isoform X1 [Sinocyclocheilus anshuiensis]